MEMKRFLTFVAAFYLCMLSSTHAQSDCETRVKLSSSEDEYYMWVKNVDLDIYKPKCKRNGGPDAFHNAVCGQLYLVECLDRHLGAEGKNYTNYCSSAPGIKQCLVDYDAVVAPCLDAEERGQQLIARSMTNALIDHICADEASFLVRLNDTGGVWCFKNHLNGNDSCLNILGNLTRLCDVNPTIVPWPYMDTSEQCDSFSEFQACFVNGLQNNCEDPTASSLFDSMFDAVKRVTPCGRHPAAQTTEANNANNEV